MTNANMQFLIDDINKQRMIAQELSIAIDGLEESLPKVTDAGQRKYVMDVISRSRHIQFSIMENADNTMKEAIQLSGKLIDIIRTR